MGSGLSLVKKPIQYSLTINGGDIFEGNLGPFPLLYDNIYNLPNLKNAIISQIYALDYLNTYLANENDSRLNSEFLDLEYLDRGEWNAIDTYLDFHTLTRRINLTVKLKINLKTVLQKHYSNSQDKMGCVNLLSTELGINKKVIEELLY